MRSPFLWFDENSGQNISGNLSTFAIVQRFTAHIRGHNMKTINQKTNS